MHLLVILVVVGHNATKPGMLTVSMWDGTVKGVVSDAVAVVAAVELWAVPGVMPSGKSVYSFVNYRLHN